MSYVYLIHVSFWSLGLSTCSAKKDLEVESWLRQFGSSVVVLSSFGCSEGTLRGSFHIFSIV